MAVVLEPLQPEEPSVSTSTRQSYFTLPTPLNLAHGNVWQIITVGEKLLSIEFCPPKILPGRFPQGAFQRHLAEKLAAYLSGERVDFSDIDLLITDGAPFHQKVWAALRQVPYGQTCSYADLAEAAGSPDASRAVGQAVGRNPIPVIIPCHRVIAKDGGLGGFMRGHPDGLTIKQFLLGLENIQFEK